MLSFHELNQGDLSEAGCAEAILENRYSEGRNPLDVRRKPTVQISFLRAFESRINVDRQSRQLQRFLNLPSRCSESHVKQIDSLRKVTQIRLLGSADQGTNSRREYGWAGPGQLVNLDLACIIKLFEACFGCGLLLFRFQEAGAASIGHSRPFQK